jgi:hypothetical protein
MRSHFLHLRDAAVKTDERIPKNGRSRLPFFPHRQGKAFLQRYPDVTCKQFREFTLIGGQRVEAEDAILLEDGVQLAGAVQSSEQRQRIVGHRARGGSRETGASGRTAGRHNVDGGGEARHSGTIELF